MSDVYAVATTMTKQNGVDLNVVTGLMVMEACSEDEARGKHSLVMATDYPKHQIFAQVADRVRTMAAAMVCRDECKGGE